MPTGPAVPTLAANFLVKGCRAMTPGDGTGRWHWEMAPGGECQSGDIAAGSVPVSSGGRATAISVQVPKQPPLAPARV